MPKVKGPGMRSFTISMPVEIVEKIDQRVKDGEWGSRSEFIRHAVWEFLHAKYIRVSE